MLIVSYCCGVDVVVVVVWRRDNAPVAADHPTFAPLATTATVSLAVEKIRDPAGEVL